MKQRGAFFAECAAFVWSDKRKEILRMACDSRVRFEAHRFTAKENVQNASCKLHRWGCLQFQNEQ
jgi:hypothetical protein